MSYQSNYLIAGAGITGIASALYCHSSGITCELHEARTKIGGILRDWFVGDDWYFRNCQYLNPSQDWYKLLPQRQLFTFSHTYGSYTDLWGEVCINRDFAGPIYSLKSPPGDLRCGSSVSLLDRLNLYPEEISKPLIEWVSRFIKNPHEIHSSAVVGLQLSRIFPLYFSDQVFSYKRASQLADELYGLPRNYLRLPPLFAALPCNGFNSFFDQIKVDLETKINLHIDSNVSANVLEDRESERQDSTFVVWSGSPTPLLNKLKFEPLASPGLRMRNVVLKWPVNLFDTPFYIQVYSKKLSITRIFVYYNKATIECFSDKVNASDIVISGLEVLNSFFNNIGKPDEFHEFKEVRHFLCTTKDFYRLEKFVADSSKFRLVPSQWHIYGRDAKINDIISLIKKMSSSREVV